MTKKVKKKPIKTYWDMSQKQWDKHCAGADKRIAKSLKKKRVSAEELVDKFQKQ